MGVAGYEPNVAQNEATRWVMRIFFGRFPGICFVIGVAVFLCFRFDHDEPARVRAEISARGR